MTRHAVLAGIGSTLPERVVTNEMLAQRIDTSDEWIRSRTGIVERRLVEQGTATSDLAVEAGRRALKSAALDRVDAVVLATTTPDHPCPATAPTVASRLGLGTVAAHDVSAVCSGFLYGLATGAGLIAIDQAETLLVIGAEAFSTIIDPDDRGTAPIFGDGAGAVVLRAGRRDEPGALLGMELGSDGELADAIIVPGGGSRQRTSGHPPAPGDQFMKMQGQTVFRNAIVRMTQSCHAVLDRTGWPVETVGLLVGHQANVRILNAVAEDLGLPAERAFVNLDRYGNTAAASIPLALADAAASGAVRAGDRVLLTAFGGGASWGAATLTWPAVDPS
ncbi:MAG TPA: beta-ketoacyl-ACP synthase III [Amycolatopsis sp.]|uniref:beta-ketoacyl-ACP synthase III n=1 Tax=Amycolatopsis sp. TaxID=37632 RepID=UPI002B478615|nr:beta-ketoacyl-ACP synthase III [Amycolatopsis sp.]HKS50146.1 beta-ketoacyl-ACP synthase III [Amycolatopsis sp.]